MALAALSIRPGNPAMTPRAASAGSDESDLVDRAVAGDTAAFERIYRANERRIYAVCLRMTGNSGLAEECAQSTFIRAWENLPRFAKRSALSSWLHRIAVNEVLGRARRHKRRAAHLELLSNETPTISDAPRPGTDGADIEKAICQLPEGARHVFVLVGVEGFSHAEAAAQLGIAVGTCKAQLHRARQLLKARLGIDD